MMISTMMLAGAMLEQPAADRPGDATQIHLTCGLMVLNFGKGSPEAEPDQGPQTRTISELRESGGWIVRESATLDFGAGEVAFGPRNGAISVDTSPSNGRATFIASPRLLTLEGQEATISIGSQITVAESWTGPDDDGYYRVKFAQRTEGVELTFAGSTTPAGVRLDPLEITVTTVSGPSRAISLVDGHVESPTLSQRRLESSITVPDGALAVVPIGTMPDDSGFLVAAISARAIGGQEGKAPSPNRR